MPSQLQIIIQINEKPMAVDFFVVLENGLSVEERFSAKPFAKIGQKS